MNSSTLFILRIGIPLKLSPLYQTPHIAPTTSQLKCQMAFYRDQIWKLDEYYEIECLIMLIFCTT